LSIARFIIEASKGLLKVQAKNNINAHNFLSKLAAKVQSFFMGI
jgi:hypothetical protein